MALADLEPPRKATLSGSLVGTLGASSGSGHVRLAPDSGGTRIDYDYRVEISGKAAAVGGRMLDGATRIVIGQFFQRLTAEMAAARGVPLPSWWRRLLHAFGFKS